jgi:hypothetical protein
MSLEDKNISRKVTHTEKISPVESDSVGNYEKHPFFIKKAVAAKALLLKVGLPKQLTKKISV